MPEQDTASWADVASSKDGNKTFNIAPKPKPKGRFWRTAQSAIKWLGFDKIKLEQGWDEATDIFLAPGGEAEQVIGYPP